MQVMLRFDDEWEFRAWWEQQEDYRRSALVLAEIRDTLRQKVKYGKPTETEQEVYDLLWQTAGENELDLWGV